MTSGPWIASRVCPGCGQVMDASCGVRLFVCRACPTAVALSTAASVRVPTARPRVEPGRATVRLAFYWFRVEGGTPCGIWIPAFRALGAQKPGHAVGDLLTDTVHFLPELIDAPLGADIALDLAQARARLQSRAGLGPDAASGSAISVVLVSLGCRVKTGTLREPVTGWTWPAERVFPTLAAPNVPPARVSPSAASEGAQRARRERPAEERRRTLDLVKRIFSPGA
jgi:hypothetical protein